MFFTQKQLFEADPILFDSAIYRTAELADGWHGRIIETQVYFSKPSFILHKYFTDDTSRRP